MPPLVFFALLLAPQDRPAEKCVLSGTVVNSATAEPLNKVLVRVAAVGTEQSPAAFAMTDARGQFTLPDLDAGHYRITGSRNGYLDTYYGARRAESKGTVISLEPGQSVGDLQLKMLPFAVIAGTVRDSDGEPMVKATVTLFRLHYEDGRRRISSAGGGYTDDLGQYRIPNLVPGKYYVKAEEGQRPLTTFAAQGFVITMWGGGDGPVQPGKKAPHPPEIILAALAPGVRDTAAARVVDVDAGARVMGADVVLPRSRTVTVKGRVAAPAGIAAFSVRLDHGQGAGDPLSETFTTEVDHDGNFVFDAVPPGSYSLSANVNVESHVTPQTEIDGKSVLLSFDRPNAAACHEHMAVQIGSSNVEGLRLAISGAGEVDGHVTVEGKDKPEGLGGQIWFDSGEGDPVTAEVDTATGAFKTPLCPGRYIVTASMGSDDLLIHSLQSAGRDVMAEGLTIGGPGKEQLDVVLAAEGGQVDGTVLDADDKPVAGATVVLAPEARLRSRPKRFQQTETDQYGRYNFTNVSPGDYAVFAWEDVEPGAWFDPEFLKTVEPKGQAVTIQLKGHETVKPHVIR